MIMRAWVKQHDTVSLDWLDGSTIDETKRRHLHLHLGWDREIYYFPSFILNCRWLVKNECFSQKIRMFFRWPGSSSVALANACSGIDYLHAGERERDATTMKMRIGWCSRQLVRIQWRVRVRHGVCHRTVGPCTSTCMHACSQWWAGRWHKLPVHALGYLGCFSCAAPVTTRI
jgi:hypothetical protein